MSRHAGNSLRGAIYFGSIVLAWISKKSPDLTISCLFHRWNFHSRTLHSFSRVSAARFLCVVPDLNPPSAAAAARRQGGKATWTAAVWTNGAGVHIAAAAAAAVWRLTLPSPGDRASKMKGVYEDGKKYIFILLENEILATSGFSKSYRGDHMLTR